MGRWYQKSYYETRGYRLSDNGVSDIGEIAKENYYALAIAIITGWKPDYCLAKMGLMRVKKEYERRVEAPFMRTATLAYVLNKICGLTYKEASTATKISYHLIREGVLFVQQKRRKRHNVSRYATS